MSKLQKVKKEVKERSFVWLVPTKAVNRVLDKNFVTENKFDRKMYLLWMFNWKPFAISKRRYKKLWDTLRECWVDLYVDELNLYAVNEARKKSDFIL